MGSRFELAVFEQQLDADYLEWLVDAHAQMVQEHFSRLWDYYANPMVPLAGDGVIERKASESGRGYVQAQEGLPNAKHRVWGPSMACRPGSPA